MQAVEGRKTASKASICVGALLLVVLFAFLALAFVPWVDSQATRNPLALESPLSHVDANTATPSSLNSSAKSSTTNGSSSQAFYYVGASSSLPALEQNLGVRSYIQVKNQSIDNGVLSFWISEAFSNNLWAQTGYYIDNGSAPIAFYQIWNLTSRVEIITGTESAPMGIHLFSIASIEGTDNWNFTLDGRTFGTFDMGTNVSSSSYPIYAMSEEGYSPAGPFSFSPVTFQSAIQVLKSDSWSNATAANSFGNDWGVAGHAQNSHLGNNEFVVGSTYAELAANSNLWV